MSDPNRVVVVTNTTAPGSCPVCHNRSWTGTYSCFAWLLAIFCFPCGILCCLCMRKRSAANAATRSVKKKRKNSQT